MTEFTAQSEGFNGYVKKALKDKDAEWSTDPQVKLFSQIDKDVHMAMIN